MPTPTIKDVARASGVSYKTVSRVVNGEEDVSVATRQRIQEVIATLGYRPHHGARSMRRGRTETLRLMMHGRNGRFLANPFQDDVVSGVVDTAARHGYAVLLELIEEAGDATRHSLHDRRVDGTILLDSHLPRPRLVPHLLQAGAPCVVVANREVDPALGWVDADFEDGADRLVRHLIDLGHRRIALLSDDTTLRSTQGRLVGYERALLEAGIQPDPDLFLMAGQLREHGDAATEELLRRRSDVTAIFAINDLTAFGAIDCLRRHGCRVPEDVSVTGYDDIYPARYASPPLTTVRLPWYEMSAAAVELVIGAVEGKQSFPNGREFPVEFVLRGSTAPARR